MIDAISSTKPSTNPAYDIIGKRASKELKEET